MLVSAVITETVDLMRPLAEARSIHIATATDPPDPYYVFADHQRLKQILLNLLSNAIKYNRLGGTVTVTAKPSTTTRLRVAVTDTGLGISPDDIPLLFVPFERLAAAMTRVNDIGGVVSPQLRPPSPLNDA